MNSLIHMRWFVILSLCTTLSAQAQDEQILLKIGEEVVLVEEFKFQYRKAVDISNRSGLPLEDLSDYLERYINFKLKVIGAKSEGRDTVESYISELQQYKQELAGPFMQDAKTLESLAEEAFRRGAEELEASHILIGITNPNIPQDTAKAYRQAIEVLDWLREGKSFDSLARVYSTDPSAQTNGGYLGFFSSLQMVYPFESAAYQLQAGEFSEPVRTQYGYHIIKLHQRIPSRGEVRISHLLVRSVDGMPETDRAAKAEKIHALFAELKLAPEMWNAMVMAQSDDMGTRERGGELGWISPGKLIPEMDEAAFQLEKPGDISEPFQSAFGWHIVKLLDKQVAQGDFDAEKTKWLEQVKRDSRSALAQEKFLNEAAIAVNLVEHPAAIEALLKQADSSLTSGKWKWTTLADEDENVFSIADKKVSVKDIAQFVEMNQRAGMKGSPVSIMQEAIQAIRQKEVLEAYRAQLEDINPEYRYLVMEYRDGMLLFESMEEKVWGRSTRDTLGLISFFEANKERYRQKEKVKAKFLIARNPEARKFLLARFQESPGPEEFEAALEDSMNSSGIVLERQAGLFDPLVHPWLSEFENLSPLNALDLDNAYVIALIDEVVPSFVPELRTIRGQVINDYQEWLEKEWLDQLKRQFPVLVNKEAFDELEKVFVQGF